MTCPTDWSRILLEHYLGQEKLWECKLKHPTFYAHFFKLEKFPKRLGYLRKKVVSLPPIFLYALLVLTSKFQCRVFFNGEDDVCGVLYSFSCVSFKS